MFLEINENSVLHRLNRKKQINSQDFEIPQSSRPTADSICNAPTSVTSVTNSNKCSLEVDSQVLTLLATIKEQNTEILNFLRRESRAITTSGNILPENIPVQLPIKTEAELTALEEFLEEKVNSGHLVKFINVLL